MAKNAESTIQGLNIIPTDPLQDELSPLSDDMSRDLEAQLALWTNFQFPNSSTIPSTSIEDERVFSPERDTASRSRHKALEDFTSGAFFGNVGATLAHPPASSHAAAHERAKFQQLQQHLAAHQNNNHDENNENNQINDLFSYIPYNSSDMNLDLNPALVDPFLNPADVTGSYGALPPLTIRAPRDAAGRLSAAPPHSQPFAMQTIDPATTTLGQAHRVTIPLPTAKRQKAKGPSMSTLPGRNVIIPVDNDYSRHPTAPSSAIGDDEMDDDHHDDHMKGDYMDDTPQLDAQGQPIPYSAAEDKRRRNTLASARFRQKKKEREVAMERKARELDERVAGLERECESLRKENRMLRGLLVDGVPGTNTPNMAASSASIPDGLDTTVTGTTVLDGKNVANAGASVVLLEELVRLLKANSAVLTNAPTQAAPAPVTGRSTTTGKRKRSGAN